MLHVRNCLKLGVSRAELRGVLPLVESIPQSTLDGERFHGYGSVVKREHPRLHILSFLVKLYFAISRNLVLSPDDRVLRHLEQNTQFIQKRQPNRANGKGMYNGVVTKRAAAAAGANKRRRRQAVRQSLKKTVL